MRKSSRIHILLQCGAVFKKYTFQFSEQNDITYLCYAQDPDNNLLEPFTDYDIDRENLHKDKWMVRSSYQTL